MLHPHTELRFVSKEIGYGVFATQRIPKGTITWVRDELDRVISKEEMAVFSGPNLENLLKYTYRTSTGDYFFCWDLTRYVNHSFTPNSMPTAMGLEIAIRDIEVGDEITNDYGALNIIEPFSCAHGPHGHREFVLPDDLARFHLLWDAQIAESIVHLPERPQPLSPFLTKKLHETLAGIQRKEIPLPSILQNLYQEEKVSEILKSAAG